MTKGATLLAAIYDQSSNGLASLGRADRASDRPQEAVQSRWRDELLHNFYMVSRYSYYRIRAPLERKGREGKGEVPCLITGPSQAAFNAARAFNACYVLWHDSHTVLGTATINAWL